MKYKLIGIRYISPDKQKQLCYDVGVNAMLRLRFMFFNRRTYWQGIPFFRRSDKDYKLFFADRFKYSNDVIFGCKLAGDISEVDYWYLIDLNEGIYQFCRYLHKFTLISDWRFPCDSFCVV